MEPRPMMDRLEALFSIVPKAHAIADIGTDPEYLAVKLINRNRAEFVIAATCIRTFRICKRICSILG